jgi:hypothetical protein
MLSANTLGTISEVAEPEPPFTPAGIRPYEFRSPGYAATVRYEYTVHESIISHALPLT